MSRIDRTMLKGLGEAKFLAPERRIVDEVVKVVVLKDSTVFEEAIVDLFDLYDVRWGAFHNGAPLPVTSDELIRYCYTAVKARVSRVNNERFHTRCDDAWAVPTPIATAISGIGIIDMDGPVMVIAPEWNSDHDDMLLDKSEWFKITRKLRAIEKDPDVKLLFAHAIAGDRQGDEVLFNLVPVRDGSGRMIELTSRFDFDPIAGLVYLLLGLEPSLLDDVALPSHPLLTPYPFIRTGALLQNMYRFVNAGAA